MQNLIIFTISVFCFFSACSDGDNSSQNNSFFKDISDEVNLHFIHEPAVDSCYFMPESFASGGAFLITIMMEILISTW